MAVLGDLVRNLIIIVFINMLLEMLLPHGQFQRYIRMITGLIIILLVINTLNTMLRRAPRDREIMDVFAAAEHRVDVKAMGDALRRKNQADVLKVYRASLHELIREEIVGSGWVLETVYFELEEDPDKDNFGVIYSVAVAVRDPASGAGGQVEQVRINSVMIGSSSAKEEGEEQRLHEPVPELEQALARLLQIDPGVVSVRMVSR